MDGDISSPEDSLSPPTLLLLRELITELLGSMFLEFLDQQRFYVVEIRDEFSEYVLGLQRPE